MVIGGSIVDTCITVKDDEWKVSTCLRLRRHRCSEEDFERKSLKGIFLSFKNADQLIVTKRAQKHSNMKHIIIKSMCFLKRNISSIQNSKSILFWYLTVGIDGNKGALRCLLRLLFLCTLKRKFTANEQLTKRQRIVRTYLCTCCSGVAQICAKSFVLSIDA